jgi:hypothetical protein
MKIRLSPIVILLPFFISCHTQQSVSEQPVDISNVVYKGGDGKSPAGAVLIVGVRNERSGIAAEYAWITKLQGERNIGWKYGEQSSIMQDGKRVDVIMIYLIPSNTIITYYFDVSDFYGK